MNKVHIKDGFRRNGRIYEINRAGTRRKIYEINPAGTRRRNPYDF